VSATDTIVAVATPPGRGGIGIVRLSGGAVPEIAKVLLGGRLPPPRRAAYRAFVDGHGRVVDRGVALFFPAPGSYTGEHVLELQGHGGPVVLDMLLECALAAGARLARPGEFTQRAFLNDRLDLAQAEAVADLIDSATTQAARSALRSLEGALSQHVDALVEGVTELRALVEAGIDFPEEEDVEVLSDTRLVEALRALQERLASVQATAAQGRLLREGMSVVIAGRPNVGKSSLLNALAGRPAAIVTDVPGTTRDPIREHIDVDGLPLHVIDTAGIRTAGDAVEREGVSRAWQAIGDADALVVLVDDRAGLTGAEEAILSGAPDSVACILVHNKIDLSGRSAGRSTGEDRVTVRLSAKTGAGLELLRAALKECVGYRQTGEGGFLARRRHLDALARAGASLSAAARALRRDHASELVAEELRQAQLALGEITGEVGTEDLLERIFSRFCIGK